MLHIRSDPLGVQLAIDTYRNNETQGISFHYDQGTSLGSDSLLASPFARLPVDGYYEGGMDPRFAFALKAGKRESQ